MKIGFIITTFNRKASLQRLIEQLHQYTLSPYELIVCDDGSTDGTVEWLKEQAVLHISGRNHGMAWNMNRGLAYFLKGTDCDPIFILEDDIEVWEKGWEQEWVLAAELWGHVTYTFASKDLIISGEGTPFSPYRVRHYGSQCVATKRCYLELVGYADLRFTEGAIGSHTDWSTRFMNLLKKRWGEPADTIVAMNCHVGSNWGQTNYRKAGIKRGWIVYNLLQGEGLYRPPFITAEDATEFTTEQLQVWPDFPAHPLMEKLSE